MQDLDVLCMGVPMQVRVGRRWGCVCVCVHEPLYPMCVGVCKRGVSHFPFRRVHSLRKWRFFQILRVSVHACVLVGMYTNAQPCDHVRAYACSHVFVGVDVWGHINVYLHIRTHISVCVSECACVCVCMCL